MALRPTSPFFLPQEFTESSELDLSPTDTVLHSGEIHHEIQNDRARADSAKGGTTRAVASEPDVAGDDGRLRPLTESQPRGMDGPTQPEESGQRPQPTLERSP